MQAKKVTLEAGTTTLLATAGVGTKVLVFTALTDLYLGGDDGLTSDGASSFGAFPTTATQFDVEGELWGVSATGGVVSLLSNNAAL